MTHSETINELEKKIATLTEQIKQQDKMISRAFDLATKQTWRLTALKKSKIKYITIMLEEDAPKN